MSIDSPECPRCGSRDRVVQVGEQVTIREKLKVKGRKSGATGRPYFEAKAEDSFTRDLAAESEIVRHVNREDDTYMENIRLYDGTCITSTSCLSDH